ncbi:unnamed protein product [Ceutorhynchus assimilis]|uniref:RING-type domain-containing protein n=1 Tax=Ceutorhynchus assimilis TaxID=467358 RepID=A0A9N9QBF6_9CUCU|nr:unnamed protein product [Ceutorhynchus assimilis]
MFKCDKCDKPFKHQTNVYRHKKESCVFLCPGTLIKVDEEKPKIPKLILKRFADIWFIRSSQSKASICARKNKSEYYKFLELKMENLDDCPICFETIEKKGVSQPNLCKHQFCLKCLFEWTKTNETCPMLENFIMQ